MNCLRADSDERGQPTLLHANSVESHGHRRRRVHNSQRGAIADTSSERCPTRVAQVSFEFDGVVQAHYAGEGDVQAATDQAREGDARGDQNAQRGHLARGVSGRVDHL